MILAQRVARVLLPPVILLGLALTTWLAGLIWFAQTIPREEGWADRATDAIVVLTGGSDRISTGVQLLSEGLGAHAVRFGRTPGRRTARNAAGLPAGTKHAGMLHRSGL